MTDKPIGIGGAAGMWGDSALATPQLLADGRCDYLMYEGLAEITMAILTKAQQKDPSQGYARDIIAVIADNLPAFLESDTKVITNAGGMNPQAAAEFLTAAAEKAGVSVSIATVSGDNVIDIAPDVPEGTVSANAYFGARPIAAALDAGADIVVTGRVVDSALALGPLIHEYGWTDTDLDQLSAGSLAGHLLECGPQSTGGLLTDWNETGSWVNPGFPIALVDDVGDFTLTIAEGTDGIVDRRTVSEQIVYEIGDPTAYLLPDVTCDWTEVTLDEAGRNEVRVAGAHGTPPPPTLKTCAQVHDGFRVAVQFFVGGHEAVAKAERAGADLIARGRRLLEARGFDDFRDIRAHAVGSEATYGAHAQPSQARESLLWIAAHHDDRAALNAFVREFPSIGLAGPPGIGGAAGSGLPKPSPVLRIRDLAVDRSMVTPEVRVNGIEIPFTDIPLSHCGTPAEAGADFNSSDSGSTGAAEAEPMVTVPLVEVAHARSGDKGESVNIGVIARRPDLLPYITDQLTADAAARWMSHLGAVRVDRFALPGLNAVNFLLHAGLGASGAASLRIDPQGKAVAQQLLDFPIEIPEEKRK